MMGALLLGAAAAALAYLAVCAVCAVKCLGMVITPTCYDEAWMRAQETKNGFAAALQSYDAAWERRPFTLDRGDAVLQGECIPNPADSGPRRRVAIVCHGHTVNRIAALKYAAMFYALGWSCVIYDERHFGASTGRISTLGYKEAGDLAAVMAYARGVFGPDALLALHGESMGAATVLLVLARERPALAVADCPFADTELLVRTLLKKMHIPRQPTLFFAEALAKTRYGYDMKATSPLAAVRGSDVPICLIHGSGDTLIPCAHSRLLYEASGSPASELHVFDGADHAASVVQDPRRYEGILKAFVAKCAP